MSLFSNVIDFFGGDVNVTTTTQDQFITKIVPQLIGGANNWNGNPETISTCYTAVKILSQTISSLPLNIYLNNNEKGKVKQPQHYLYDKLHYNPNNYLTSQSFFQTLEVHRNFTGNAFARIHRNANTGRVNNLEIISPSRVIGYDIEKGELYYKLKRKNSDKPEIVHSADLLHFRHISRDGIWGLNPIHALRLNLSTTAKGLQTIDAFYENNANTSKAIKSTIGGANQKAMLEAIEKFKEEYGGSLNAGKLIPLPPNTELQDVAMSFVDAQFISTIKFNADQIGALYGVPSHLLGNYESSKFNNVEQLQLNYKANTVASTARMYRQEMEFKLLTGTERKAGYSIEFNTSAMLELDQKTKMESYKTLIQHGVITPNTVAKLENYETFAQGNYHYLFNQVQPLESLYDENGNVKNKTDGE